MNFFQFKIETLIKKNISKVSLSINIILKTLKQTPIDQADKEKNSHGYSTGNNISLLYLSMWLWLMVFNATFNNISVKSWRSVLLVEETRVPRENHRPVASH
jgi:hypothetical protein